MNYIGVSILGYESKEKYPIYVSKNTFRRHVNLLLKEEEGERHFFFVVIVCYYFVVIITFSTAEISKSHVNNRFKINGKQMIQIPQKDEYLRFKNYEKKIKSLLASYTDFESVLVPEDKQKQNLGEFSRDKHQQHVDCNYGY